MLLNDLAGKIRQLIEIWIVYVILEKKIFIKNSTKITTWKLVSGFFICKELSAASMENRTFEATSLCCICNSKTVKTCPSQHAHLLRFHFTEDSFKIKKGFVTCFQATFFAEFFDKNYSFIILYKPAKFHYQTINMFHVSGIWWRHDIWILENLKFDYVKSEKWKKQHMTLLYKFHLLLSLLDVQNKLAKCSVHSFELFSVSR